MLNTHILVGILTWGLWCPCITYEQLDDNDKSYLHFWPLLDLKTFAQNIPGLQGTTLSNDFQNWTCKFIKMSNFWKFSGIIMKSLYYLLFCFTTMLHQKLEEAHLLAITICQKSLTNNYSNQFTSVSRLRNSKNAHQQCPSNFAIPNFCSRATGTFVPKSLDAVMSSWKIDSLWVFL